MRWFRHFQRLLLERFKGTTVTTTTRLLQIPEVWRALLASEAGIPAIKKRQLCGQVITY